MTKKKRFLLTFVLFAIHFVAVLAWVSDGFTHFNYTLDDPYIHLQLARNIWHGHYGFNSAELSAPSSSVLWPLVLAPFSSFGFYELVPLVLNIILSLCFAGYLFKILEKRGWSERATFLVTLLGLLVINCVGLALTGLEHVLQILVVLVIVDKILMRFPDEKVGDQNDVSVAGILALALLIRYEMLVFWVAIVGFYILSRQFRKAVLVVSLSLLPLVMFSLFLSFLKLGFLPASVMAKTKSHAVFPLSLLGNVWANVVSRPGMMLILLTLVAVALCVKSKKANITNLWIIITPAVLHILVGRFGWFYRYEVYIYLYLSLLILMLIDFKKMKSSWVAVWTVFFVIVYWPYLGSVGKLRQACRNIYYQQGVTVDFLNKYLPEAIGTNDIGYVGFKHPFYVLDLYGLASKEALDYRLHAPNFDWVTNLAKEHNVEVIFVYLKWINPNSDWVKVAEFETTERSVVLGYPILWVYAKPTRVAGLRKDLIEFQKTIQRDPIKLRIY